jgi:NADH:ubiquinone oxidoreductase subunit H
MLMSLKFLVLIALLIFIRGGVPRYRYDFLTKMG